MNEPITLTEVLRLAFEGSPWAIMVVLIVLFYLKKLRLGSDYDKLERRLDVWQNFGMSMLSVNEETHKRITELSRELTELQK